MEANRRNGAPAIPDDINSILTDSQQRALKQLAALGWKLHLVRRPLFQPVHVFLEHESGKFALLTKGGELDHKPRLRLRREVIEPVELTEEELWAYGTEPPVEVLYYDAPGSATIVNFEPVPKPAAGSAGKDRPTKKILV